MFVASCGISELHKLAKRVSFRSAKAFNSVRNCVKNSFTNFFTNQTKYFDVQRNRRMPFILSIVSVASEWIK